MERRKPIYSVHEDKPELQEPINEFVIGLAERIDGLQDLHSLADFDRLGEQCRELAAEAERLGYPVLASVASSALEACRDRKGEVSEEALVEMTDLAQRIRQAHRGAA
jgi:hypothetical protein